MKIGFILSLIFGSFFVLSEQGNLATKNLTFEEALSVSKTNNKMLMIKLTADNCKYCIKMDKEVLVDKEVQTFLDENFISLTVNVDKETIPLGVKRTITPSFIFVNNKGKIISKVPGSWNKKDFLEILNSKKLKV